MVGFVDTSSSVPDLIKLQDLSPVKGYPCHWWHLCGDLERHSGSEARRDLASLNQEPLMLAPLLDGGWMERAVTTEEASDWLMMLLRKESQAAEPTAIHTLKTTPLSWCAKHGLEPNHRLILGHHVTGKQSLECYSRDALAAPLRDFERVLFEIRTGAFAPDQNRSGMMQTAKKSDPADLYRSEHQSQPNQSLEEESGNLDHVEDSSSSSSSSTEDISEEEAELRPDDPVAQPAKWDPDYEMFQRKRSSVVHVRAKGGSQDTFSCGTTLTDQYEQIEVARFLLFRKCKRCELAKPIRDVGQFASALKKRRLELGR